MFSKTTNLTHAWSKRKQNVWVPVETTNVSYTAVIAAISEGCGVEYIELHDSAVDSQSFKDFLRKLRHINKGIKITLVMDNLPAHKTNEVKELML